MADDDRYPSQLAERFQIRLPDGMRDRLKAQAEANKRSMNAEIIARLQASFAPKNKLPPPEVPSQPPVLENTVYILLDTNGMPISWNESITHLSEINKAGKLKVVSQHSRVLSSVQISDSKRKDHDLALFMKYRRLNKDKLSKTALEFLEAFEAIEADDDAKK